MGASTSLFGIIGMTFVVVAKTWTVSERPCRTLTLLSFTVVLNLVIGLLPFVDNFAHFGGFFTGFFLSCMIFGVIKAIPNPRYIRLQFLAVDNTEGSGPVF